MAVRHSTEPSSSGPTTRERRGPYRDGGEAGIAAVLDGGKTPESIIPPVPRRAGDKGWILVTAAAVEMARFADRWHLNP